MCRAQESVETLNAFIGMDTVTPEASTKRAASRLVRVLKAELAERYRK
jgi:hypothetical protein